MANRVLTEYEIRFTGNADAIASQGIAALRKIEQQARSTGSARGVGPQVTELSRRVAQAQLRAGASPADLLRTQRIFQQHVEGMRKALNFRGGVVNIEGVIPEAQRRAQNRTNTEYISSLRQASEAQRRQAEAITKAKVPLGQLQLPGFGATTPSAQKVTAAQQAREAARQTAFITGRLKSEPEAGAEGAAQAADARKRLAVSLEALQARTVEDTQIEARLVVLKQRQAEALAAAVNQLQGRSAGPFQRLLFASHNRGGGGGGGGGFGARSAADEQSFGQYIGNHAIRTLGYAIPGIAIGVGFAELHASVQEAKKAQRSMTELRAEFEGLGQSDQFSGFAGSVKQIASDTGVAVSEVAQLGIAMKGVYGDTSQATIATRAIAQATVTLGLSLQQAQEDMIGISQGFSDLQSRGGAAQQDIQNLVLHIQDKTGVEARELLPGLADVASTADLVGFSSKQTADIIGAAAQHYGPGSSAGIGQTLSKIITSLSSDPKLLVQTEQYLKGVPGAGVSGNISSQPIGDQVRSIFNALGALSKQPSNASQYSYILNKLGINAAAKPFANAIFSTGAQAQGLDASQVPANRGQQEFNKQMDTLAGRLSQLKSDLTNLGVAILDSGFGHALTEIVHDLGLFINELTHLNKETHGAAGVMLGLAGTAAVVAAFSKAIVTAAKVIEGLKLATEAATVAEGENAAANTAGGLGGLLGKGKGGLNAILGKGRLPLGKLGGIGGAAEVGLPEALLLAAAGYGAFKGTTAILDTVSGKPKSVKPSAHLADQSKDLEKNFIKTHGAVTEELAKRFGFGSFALVEAQADIKSGNNDALLRLYNQLQSNPGAEPFAQSVLRQQAIQNTFAAAAKDPAVAAYLKAQSAASQQQAALSSPYLHAMAAANIENTDTNAVAGGYETGAIGYQQGYNALANQTTGTLAEFQGNPSAPGFEAYVQAQQAQIQFAYSNIGVTQATATANAREDPLKIAQASLDAANSQKAAVLQAGGTTSSSDYQQAQAAATTAAQQVLDNQNKINQAQIGVTKAYDTAAGDVLAQAKDDQALAAAALSAAHGKAEQLQAQAQQIAADREFVTAQNAIATAQTQLLTAMANATGNHEQIIKAAESAAATSLANANRIKAADQKLNKDPNTDQAFLQAMTQYYNDQSTAANTVVQETISTNETLLFLGRETAVQAIANLQGALLTVKGNEKATNALLSEIRQIQNSAAANLNFDLPTTLFAATLYQARALGAGLTGTGVTGGPVTVTINVNGGSPGQVTSAVSALTAAVGGAQRTGTLTPLLNG